MSKRETDMAATLCVHAGGVRRSREELFGIPTPPATKTFTPVPHAVLVESLTSGLTNAGIRVVREQYATMGRQDSKLFGVLNLSVPGFDSPDMAAALGFRTANDRSMALRATAGTRVFVCDNMALSGDGILLNRRHTGRLRIDREIPAMIDTYLGKITAWAKVIDRLKNTPVSDSMARELIYDAVLRHEVVPTRLIKHVHNLYFEDDAQRERHPDRTLWGLNNAFTEAVKTLKPQSEYNSGLRIGRFFSRAARLAAPSNN
jgi:hypothetical protein